MHLLDALDSDDACVTVFTVIVIVTIGHVVCTPGTWPRERGKQFGWLAMVAFAAWKLTTEGEHWNLARLAIRAPMVGSLAVGLAWILLPAVRLVDDYRRSIQASLQSRRERRRWEVERQREVAEEHERRCRQNEEWERTRPERERAAQAAAERARLDAERQQQEARQRADEQRRREEVRYQTRLLYDRYAKELKTSIRQKRFDEYLSTYLSDRYSADQVERRGADLQAMLRDTVKPAAPQKPRRTLTDIQTEFARRRAEIAASALDEGTKAALLVDLNREEDKTVREAMQQ